MTELASRGTQTNRSAIQAPMPSKRPAIAIRRHAIGTRFRGARRSSNVKVTSAHAKNASHAITNCSIAIGPERGESEPEQEQRSYDDHDHEEDPVGASFERVVLGRVLGHIRSTRDATPVILGKPIS